MSCAFRLLCVVLTLGAFSASAVDAAPSEGAAPAAEPPAPTPQTTSKRTLAAPKFSGFLQPGFTWGPAEGGPAGEFFLRRVRLSLAGDLGTPMFGYAVSAELAKPQKPLRDAYLSLRHAGQELRFGQFKVPFGWEGPTSATKIPFIERSLVERLAIGNNLRDIGVGLFGRVKLAEGWAIEDGIAVVNGAGANAVETTAKKDVFARVGVLQGERLRFGVSGSSVERSARVGTDASVSLGPVTVFGEYARGFFSEREPGVRVRNAEAFYAAAIVRPLPGFELLARFEQFREDRAADARTSWGTVGANYTYAPLNAKVQLNYRHDLGTSNDDLLLAQTQFTF